LGALRRINGAILDRAALPKIGFSKMKFRNFIGNRHLKTAFDDEKQCGA